jgi:hypothetical protein
MTSALKILDAELEELADDVGFLGVAERLRPRLGGIVNWNGDAEAIQLARDFMGARQFHADAVYGSCLVRLMASVERYLRGLYEHVLDRQRQRSTRFEDLPLVVANSNTRYSGRILASIDEPRDHVAVDVEQLVDNLATCRTGRADFRINSAAFAATIMNTAPATITRLLESAGSDPWWDIVGRDAALATLLSTRGSRATGARAQDRLKDLCKRRNHIAHGSETSSTPSRSELEDALTFVRILMTSLDSAIVSKVG